MDLVPAPLSGSRVTREWLQQVTDTANTLAASSINIVTGTVLMPHSSFVQVTTAIGTYWRSDVLVAFPLLSFVDMPIIVCSIGGSSPGLMIEASFSDATSAGFTARCARSDNPSASTTYEWMAMGATQ